MKKKRRPDGPADRYRYRRGRLLLVYEVLGIMLAVLDVISSLS